MGRRCELKALCAKGFDEADFEREAFVDVGVQMAFELAHVNESLALEVCFIEAFGA